MAAALPPSELLWPRPHRATPGGAPWRLPSRLRIAAAAPETTLDLGLDRLAATFRELGVEATIDPGEAAGAAVRLEVAAAGDALPESYRLEVTEGGARVRAGEAVGLLRGVATLVQWVGLARRDDGSTPGLAAVDIADRPDLAHRGVLLDVSRDKVPRLATLCDLVDLLSALKVNQLQLYTEHTFAYAGHERVWRGSSPLTPDDVRRLDAHCQRRGVELVPNQNSFGHLHRWLVHEPYRRLAECPDGIVHPWSDRPEPFSLCPLDPGSLELLAELYDQLLPCFASRLFNAGLDETIDLGRCRSAAACAARGKERVYLDFVRQVHALVAARGHRMQLWGDVVMERPELLAELPADAIALEWGYEADHPFDEHGARWAAADRAFYLCPGTSGWLSFAGRTTNALLNLASAARHGRSHGATGMLICDWGDGGHLQPLPVSYPAWLAGAGFAWNAGSAERPLELPLAALLDRHVFRDAAGVTGAAALALGDVYRYAGALPKNRSALFPLLLSPERPLASPSLAGVSRESLERCAEAIDEAAAPLSGARLGRPDTPLVLDELRWATDAMRLACRLGQERLCRDDAPLTTFDAATRRSLAQELDALIAGHGETWRARNRLGGMDRSAARLRRVLRLLTATAPPNDRQEDPR